MVVITSESKLGRLLAKAPYWIILIGILLLLGALAYQPKISDDWHMLWKFQQANSAYDFVVGMYNNWTGRLWVNILPVIFLGDWKSELAYRIITIFQISLLPILVWYAARGEFAMKLTGQQLDAFLIFSILLWFALPNRAETVFWFSGNIVYLFPGVCGLMFIALVRHIVYHTSEVPTVYYPLILLVGFLSGASQEQVSVCALVSFTYFIVTRGWRNIVRLPLLICGSGLLLGMLVLFFAPGNSARVEKIAAPSVIEIIVRMGLYIPGAFFELGTGSIGKYILIGFLFVLTLYLPMTFDKARVRSLSLWMLLAITSLAVMTPATNFISVRTTFLSVVFLFAGLAAIIETRSLDIAQANYRRIILIVLSTLFVAENLNGLITNISLRAEFDHRWSIIGQKSNGTCDHAIHVPHIATQPSSLSYIQTPGHDREFLSALSRRLGCEVKHSSSTSDPLPNSFKPMKAIKFYLRH